MVKIPFSFLSIFSTGLKGNVTSIKRKNDFRINGIEKVGVQEFQIQHFIVKSNVFVWHLDICPRYACVLGVYIHKHNERFFPYERKSYVLLLFKHVERSECAILHSLHR